MRLHILRVVAFFYLAITSSQATLLPIVGGAVAAVVAVKGALLGAQIAGGIHKHVEEVWKQQLGNNTQMPKAIQDCMKGDVSQQGGVDGKSLIRFESFVNPKGIANANLITNGNANANANANLITNGNANANANLITNGNANANADNINTGKTGSQQTSQSSNQANSQTWGGQTQISNKGLYGPPRSSASDMAKSYGAPINSSPNTNTNTNTANTNTNTANSNTNTNTVNTNTSKSTTTSIESTHSQKAISTIENSVSSLFFTDKDLSLGKKMNLHFETSSNKAPFLPRNMVDKYPFTIANFPQVLDAFNLTANSQEARIMKEVLTYCEDDKPGDKCCNSLETMVDFATSIVGKNVKAISAMVDKDRKLEYKVQGFKNLPCGEHAVLCHKVPFPCAVFYCQKVEKMTVFLATLVAVDGSTINAPAICHQDTNSWNPGHWAFQTLNAKPGSCPICHFLLDDDVLWIAKQ